MARLRPSHPWNPGYVLPQNVMDEPYGEGVIITKQMPRGTISALQPAYLVGGPGAVSGVPAARNGSLGAAGGRGSIGCAGGSLGSGGRGSLSGTVLDGTSLDNGVDLGGGGDPIANFGKNAAQLIMTQVKALPANDRVTTLRQILDSLEAGLSDKVATRTEAIQKKTGAGPATAMQQAIADLMSQHYLEQLKKLGATRQTPSTGVLALMGSPDGLGGFWGDVWGGISGGASKVGSAAKTVGKGIAGLACKAAGSSALQAAAGAGGGAAGATGAQLATQLCGGKSPATDTYVPPVSTGPSIGTIALIGGGLLAAVLLLRK